MKIVVRNRRAFHEYFFEDRFEAGLALRGSEVKSLRDGRVNLGDSYVLEEEGELFLVGCNISHYPFANLGNHDPMRNRKLLLHRTEIRKISRKLIEKGYTAIPLSIYFKDGKAKVEIGLAHGKKQVDKREDIRKRDADREAQRAWRNRGK